MYDYVTLFFIVTFAASLGYMFGRDHGYNEASRKYSKYLSEKHNDINIFI